MKKLLAVFAIFALASLGTAGVVTNTSGTLIRHSAILTTSNVLTTTFTLPAAAKAAVFVVDFTKGSLTSADFTPAGAHYGNPAATGYYGNIDARVNVTADEKILIRVPREAFGSAVYGGLYIRGNGTATSSAASAAVKFEY